MSNVNSTIPSCTNLIVLLVELTPTQNHSSYSNLIALFGRTYSTLIIWVSSSQPFKLYKKWLLFGCTYSNSKSFKLFKLDCFVGWTYSTWIIWSNVNSNIQVMQTRLLGWLNVLNLNHSSNIKSLQVMQTWLLCWLNLLDLNHSLMETDNSYSLDTQPHLHWNVKKKKKKKKKRKKKIVIINIPRNVWITWVTSTQPYKLFKLDCFVGWTYSNSKSLELFKLDYFVDWTYSTWINWSNVNSTIQVVQTWLLCWLNLLQLKIIQVIFKLDCFVGRTYSTWIIWVTSTQPFQVLQTWLFCWLNLLQLKIIQVIQTWLLCLVELAQL